MGSIFDTIKIEERLKELEGKPPFQPDKYEPRFTVTQFFDDSVVPVECTLYFVIRNGEPVFYDSKTINLKA